MTLQEAIKVIDYHNNWRRGLDVTMTEPTRIGEAIDVIVKHYIDPNIKLTGVHLLKLGAVREANTSKHHEDYYSFGFCDCKYSFAYAPFRGDWAFYHSYTDALNEEDNNRYDPISFGLKTVKDVIDLLRIVRRD